MDNKSRQPNVLFILTDQWQHDAFGYWDHPLAKTPNLDRLAASSVSFRHAFSTVPLCSPARGTLMTGRWPHQTGMEDNYGVGASPQQPLGEAIPTWIEAAVGADFQVGYFGKWHLGADGPMVRGATVPPEGIERTRMSTGPHAPNAHETGGLLPDPAAKVLADFAARTEKNYPPFYAKIEGDAAETEDGRIAQQAIDFLGTQQENEQPWFCTASFYGPHFAHDVPDPYASMFDPADVTMPASLYDDFANKPWFQHAVWWTCHDTSHLDEDGWAKTAAAYHGMIAMRDAFIGQILEAADAVANGRPTLVVFAADHGEMLGAHNRFDKGAYFYDEVMRIPLMICLPEAGKPGIAKQGSGPIWRDEHVNLIDLAETFFDLSGQSSDGPGRDLLALLRDESTEVWSEESYGWYNWYNGHSFALRSIRTPEYKYSFNPQAVDELYDLQDDPHEKTNRIDDSALADVRQELRGRLFDWMRRERDPLAAEWQSVPAAGTFSRT